jgi:hypothetical protein
MDFDLNSHDEEFIFSLEKWKSIREIIIKITFFHMQTILDDTENNFESERDYIYEKIMRKLIKSIFSKKLDPDVSLSDIVTLYMHNSLNLNTLIHYEIGGLYALCNKKDNEGYYTPGNSLDICNLFDEIEFAVKKYNSSLYDTIYAKNKPNIYNCFKKSYENNVNIIIP